MADIIVPDKPSILNKVSEAYDNFRHNHPTAACNLSLIRELCLDPKGLALGVVPGIIGCLAFEWAQIPDSWKGDSTFLDYIKNSGLPESYFVMSGVAGAFLGSMGVNGIRNFKEYLGFRRSLNDPYSPVIVDREFDAHGSSISHPGTSTGNNLVVLVSGWNKGRFDRRLRIREGEAIVRRFRDTNEFLGHPISALDVVYDAHVSDIESAVMNPDVSSMILVGHSSVGHFPTSDGGVTGRDITRWKKSGGHCKTGFGWKAGCNIAFNEDCDKYPLLASIYGHPDENGESHGDLLVTEGSPVDEERSREKGYLNGSRITYPYQVMDKYARLVRLKPKNFKQKEAA